MKRISATLALVAVAACGQADAPSPQAPDSITSGIGLERAALESGVVADVGQVSPVGLYRRRHEAGSDLLCVTPAGEGRLRFGTEATFGVGERCAGHGTARRTGNKLILSFARAGGCIVVAQYDGDRIAMPGVIDMKCDRLCEGRGSLEGVSFPRVAAEASVARSATDAQGDPLCEAD